MRKLSGKDWMVLLLEAIMLIMLLFGKWLGVEALFINEKTTLLHFGKIVADLSEYISQVPVALVIFVYGGLAASVLSICVTCMSVFKPVRGKNTSEMLHGFYVPAVFAACIVLLVIIANAAIKSKSNGWISNIFALSVAPFITMVLGVGGMVAYKRIPNDSLEIARDAVQNAMVHAVDVVSKETAVCPTCGAKCKEGTVFCAQCGTRLPVSETHRCAKCGAKLPDGAKFCASCGTATNVDCCEDNTAIEMPDEILK